jgi:hypothetical protein
MKTMDTNELIEKYILNKMTPSERKGFEVRLKNDGSLAKELALNRKVIEGIRQYAKEESMIASFRERYDKEQQEKVRKFVIVRIAATVLLLVAAGWLVVHLVSQKLPEKSVTVKENKPIKVQALNKPDTVGINKKLLAENKLGSFRELKRFETLANQEYRSEDAVNVISPKKARKLAPNENIIFNWQSVTNQLSLVIFDNQGIEIFRKKVSPPFNYKENLPEGLYYWQLENEEDLVFVGKFVIKQQKL